MTQSRAERRRAMRDAAKKTPEAFVIAPRGSQAPLALSYIFFVAASMALASTQGWEFWAPGWSVYAALGYAGLVAGFLAGFALWVRAKSRFFWSWRWYLWVAAILLVGLVLGGSWAAWIAGRIEHRRYTQTVERHKDLINTTEQWAVGTAWTAAQCSRARTQQKELWSDLMNAPAAPNIPQLSLAVAVEQVLFQAGCSDEWPVLNQTRLTAPTRWQTSAPVHTERMWKGWRDVWPKLPTGCVWEANRAQSLGNTSRSRTISAVCAVLASDDMRPWVPNAVADAVFVQEGEGADDAPPAPAPLPITEEG